MAYNPFSMMRESKGDIDLGGTVANTSGTNTDSGLGMNSLLASLRAKALVDPNAMANQASIDVQAQIDEQRASNVRQQGEMGLSPIGFTNNESIYGAALKAGAANRARLEAEQGNFGRLATVTQMAMNNQPRMGGGITVTGNRGREKLQPTGMITDMGGRRRFAMNGGRF